MLKVLIPTIMLIPTALLAPLNIVFPLCAMYSMMITLLLFKQISPILSITPMVHNSWLLSDKISTPLVLLTAWITPLMIMASQQQLNRDTSGRKRMFLVTCAMLQMTLLMSFTAMDLALFYVMFESTLIPTLILITRWGSQAERLNAGLFFLFYTLLGSLPLLIMILILSYWRHNTNMLILSLSPPCPNHPVMWMACMMAFMIKMPLYGLHLWLPKAHVEAPIAGSMALAAVLLKLGGYGMLRMMPALTPATQMMYYPFIVMSLWGMIMTSLICIKHPDLKAIIAYSSVSHMGLVTAAILIQTPLSISGAMILMIAHGLTSSMLFCLANTSYERSHTRTLILTRGLQIALPLMTTWWLLSGLMNMSFPPSINLTGELLTLLSLYCWASMTIMITGLTTLITATYTLYIYLNTQPNKTPTNTMPQPTHTREHLLMLLHLIPLVLLILNPGLLL